MITLSADIELVYDKKILEAENITLEKKAGSPPLENNISANLSDILNKKATPRNPFILGVSKFSEGATYAKEKEDFWIGAHLCDENGNFVNITNGELLPYTLTITQPKNFSDTALLAICFDDYNKYHPRDITVTTTITRQYDEPIVTTKTYKDDDAVFVIPQEYVYGADTITHEITISNWNAPNRPLVIQGIYYFKTLSIDKSNILSLERNISDRNDFTMASFGLVSETAKLTFSDYSGEVRDYAELGLLKKGLETVFYINNTLTGKKEQIGKYVTKKWSYDADNREVNVTLQDEAERLQAIEIPKLPLQEPMTKYKVFDWIWGKMTNTLRNSHPIWTFDFEEGLLDFLNSEEGKIPFPYLDTQNAWSALTKFCEISACHIYKPEKPKVVKNNSGQVVRYLNYLITRDKGK